MIAGHRLGFIGSGNMAEALCRGILKAELVPPGDIIASDPSPERRQLFARARHVTATPDNLEVLHFADVIILAIKPQQLDAVLTEIGGKVSLDHHLISIVAGATTARIEKSLPRGTRLIRAMPNTPMLVGQGMTALARGRHATEADLTLARAIFSAASEVIVLDESLMDVVTATSGSGPAYFFYFVEAIVEGAVAEGLSRDQAIKLAAVTMGGAAELLSKSSQSPEELRLKVTSPGGTTEAALKFMEEANLKDIITSAVRAAARRSKELASS